MSTPPRSIRLDEPTYSREHTDAEDITEDEDTSGRDPSGYNDVRTPQKRVLSSKLASNESESFLHGRNASDPSMTMMENAHGNLGPWDEIQLVRRQIAKLNHRLMAVELENQQQQQRELILTVLVSCYFVGKFFMWLNRSP